MYTLEKVWPEWKIIKEIGRGSYGVVYKCVKEEKNNKLYSAVKVISVPRDEFEMDDVVSEKMTQEQSKAYYKDIADDLLKEIEILKSLKGTKNIVEIYDAKVVEKEDGIGWNIFISMEMLTDFTSYASDKKFTQEEVIKLGTDLCSALSVCHKARIIHRDIKPENIFVDDFGNFKLGDFGVAKQMEKTRGSVSVKGTYGYMSPEVFSGKKCDGRADLYSLSLVMYKLLNNNRFPFIDADKQIVKYSERQQAFERRIKGEAIPAIKGISDELNSAILKACSFKSIDRQKNIDEFRKQLESIGKVKKSGKKAKIAIAAAAAVVILVSSVAIAYNAFNPDKQNTDQVEVSKPTIENEEIASVGGGLTEHNSANGNYIIENEGKYYLINKDDGELLNADALNNAEKVLACSKNYCYFVEKNPANNTYNLYRYNFDSGIKSDAIVSGSTIESVLTATTKSDKKSEIFIYVTEVTYNDENKETVLKRIKLSNKEDERKEEDICTDIFEYNGYLVYGKKIDSKIVYECYNTITDGITKTISDNIIPDTEFYVVNNILYFAEESPEGNIVIKSFDFECMKEASDETVTDVAEDENEAANAATDTTDGTATVPEQEDLTKEIADLGDIGIEYASWKLTGPFNDKFAVIYNETPQAEEGEWYIWNYSKDEPEPIPIKDAEKLFVEGNYEIYTDGDMLKVAVWESYICHFYQIDCNDGHSFLVKSVCTKVTKDKCYRIGDSIVAVVDGDEDVITAEDIDNVNFIDKNETVYPIDGAVAYKVPEDIDDYYKSSKYLNENIGLTKLGESSDNWTKVLYDNEILYIRTDKLRGYELQEQDITNLITKITADPEVNDVEVTDYINDGNEYKFIMTAKRNRKLQYDVNLKVVAVLDDNRIWEIKEVIGNTLPKDLSAMKQYIKDKNVSNYTYFSVYDLDHDGTYELIVYKKQRYGVYSLKKSDEKYRQIGANNIISTEEIELYEIKNQGLLCYYENDVKSYDENGNINLKIIGVGENGIYESDMSYTGPEEDIVKLEPFELAEYKEVLI